MVPVQSYEIVDFFYGLYRNDLTAENAEGAEREERDEYRTMLPDLILFMATRPTSELVESNLTDNFYGI